MRSITNRAYAHCRAASRGGCFGLRSPLRPAAWGLLALLLVGSGCASTGVVRTGGAARPAKAASCALDVYATREDVGRPFQSVCLVSSESGSTLFNDRSDAGRLEAAKRKACECGADAIVVRDMSRTATQFGRGYSQARISIEAIAYTDSR